MSEIQAYEVGPDETEAEPENTTKKKKVKKPVVSGEFKAIARGSRNDLPSPNKVFAAETNFDEIIKSNTIGQI